MHVNLNLAVLSLDQETYHCVPPLHLSTISSLVLNDTFGSSERGLWSFAPIATVVLIKGQTVFPSSRHHLCIGLQILGAG